METWISPTEFEHLTKAIYQKLLGSEGISVLNQETLIGQSGCRYRVDVSFVLELPTVRLLIVVECKHENRPVSRQQVQSFSQLIRDVGASKGILVSSSGFQKGAKLVAQQQNIALVRLLIALDSDKAISYTVEVQSVLRHMEKKWQNDDISRSELMLALDWTADGLGKIITTEFNNLNSNRSLLWVLLCTPSRSVLEIL